jgi:hypothetical protein
MEKQIHSTLDLTHREAVEMAAILRHYLDTKPEGEAAETAKRFYSQLEPKTRLRFEK